MSKPFLVQRANILSIGMLSGGLAMIIIATLALKGIAFTEMGNWDYWVLIIGVFVALIGGLWFATYISNIRKFHKLLNEQSKANFMKKQDDIEYLAWQLPLKYENELAMKKKYFGLK
ncbi:MAG: hypothetical protein GX307_02535 [Euryarchaeota archaeon]|nr:hypothetical protein [Euryarchaeota archaeon]